MAEPRIMLSSCIDTECGAWCRQQLLIGGEEISSACARVQQQRGGCQPTTTEHAQDPQQRITKIIMIVYVY